MKLKFVTLLTVITLLPLTLSGCWFLAGAAGGGAAVYAANDDRKTSQIVDDASITAGIKTRYIEDKNINALDINVDTRNGVVSLYGNVPSAGVESRAVRIAESVKGVRRVVSKLTIVP